MSDIEATPAEEIVYALRAADAGFPADRADFSTEAVAFCAFNGYLDHDAKLTGKGRKFLATVGPVYRGC